MLNMMTFKAVVAELNTYPYKTDDIIDNLCSTDNDKNNGLMIALRAKGTNAAADDAFKASIITAIQTQNLDVQIKILTQINKQGETPLTIACQSDAKMAALIFDAIKNIDMQRENRLQRILANTIYPQDKKQLSPLKFTDQAKSILPFIKHDVENIEHHARDIAMVKIIFKDDEIEKQKRYQKENERLSQVIQTLAHDLAKDLEKTAEKAQKNHEPLRADRIFSYQQLKALENVARKLKQAVQTPSPESAAAARIALDQFQKNAQNNPTNWAKFGKAIMSLITLATFILLGASLAIGLVASAPLIAPCAPIAAPVIASCSVGEAIMVGGGLGSMAGALIANSLFGKNRIQKGVDKILAIGDELYPLPTSQTV